MADDEVAELVEIEVGDDDATTKTTRTRLNKGTEKAVAERGTGKASTEKSSTGTQKDAGTQKAAAGTQKDAGTQKAAAGTQKSTGKTSK